jgi:RNA polymerase sigma factor (TIGR02999 family)
MKNMNNSSELEQIENLLTQWSIGTDGVEDELISLLYPYIHKIARKQFKSNNSNSLQTTEIVSEAFIKLSQQKSVDWKNKNHFLAVAAKVIRRVIIDNYRSDNSQKRGRDQQILTLERVQEIIEDPSAQPYSWLHLDKLLNEFKLIDPAAAEVVEYKIFGGLTIPEMSNVMAVSESTIIRNWKFARSWLLLKFK